MYNRLQSLIDQETSSNLYKNGNQIEDMDTQSWGNAKAAKWKGHVNSLVLRVEDLKTQNAFLWSLLYEAKTCIDELIVAQVI